jgi:hypothetical protein
MVWEEIQGFRTPGEYQRFVEYIESQTRGGTAREVWRLIPPDPPFTGLWEPVRRGDA